MKTNAMIAPAAVALRSGAICLLACALLRPVIQAAEPARRTEAPVETAAGAGVDQKVRMNFRGVPLGMVLEYFAEAAGFTIVLETPAKGTVDVWSDRPLSHQEALDLLNSALIKNGLAALRKDHTLTIVQRDEIKTRSVPVKVATHSGQIPENDEVVTQIIPVRNSTAADLLKDLQPLVSSHAMLTANEAANAIVITDVQTTIHKVAEIIEAMDAGAEDVVTLKVIRLQNCDPTELAELLAQAFPDVNSSQTDQATQFGRPPGMGFGGLGGFGGLPGPGGQTQASGN
ncbi:MAG TPA: secretin N-terminal domain-containing protein, partial [Clostridia bacterium]|nr:secretin N-terminal domain-containing protein [Clostridia bacterium]